MSNQSEPELGDWEELHGTVYDGRIHWRDLFDERQKKEIAFSILYAHDFAHGTDGHNAKMIIAKLVHLLNAVQDNITFYSDEDQHKGI